MHSALKLEKSAISKVQKNIICILKNGKKNNFCTRKNSENCIFGSFKLFSYAKIDFLPFLKMQIMFFCTFEIALFSNFRALCLLSLIRSILLTFDSIHISYPWYKLMIKTQHWNFPSNWQTILTHQTLVSPILTCQKFQNFVFSYLHHHVKPCWWLF